MLPADKTQRTVSHAILHGLADPSAGQPLMLVCPPLLQALLTPARLMQQQPLLQRSRRSLGLQSKQSLALTPLCRTQLLLPPRALRHCWLSPARTACMQHICVKWLR